MELECTCEGEPRHGVSRSIVRRIGSNLPLDTSKRLYIQLPSPERSGQRYAATGERFEPSSSSSSSNEGLTVASYLNERQPGDGKSAATATMTLLQMDTITEEEAEGCGYVPAGAEGLGEEGEVDDVFPDQETSSSGQQQKKEALHKISALEGELARLKAQIAVYALAETRHIPDPPPPPPPPLSATEPTPAEVQYSSSVQQSLFQEPATPKPNMSDVLRDIGSVRLKTVTEISRSPGGTPLRGRNSQRGGGGGGGDPNDPGSIIAHALRKKFSHRVFQDSPSGDKENLNMSDASLSAGFDSPTTKLFN